ncbi:hypothetical protein ACFQ6S_10430 [Streptomyces sp. NPDC056479]|uniref:hypothetical protein n=1 Tax=Streptomyces sp. NPDC056479 TaxID=3345832 RepID=UPI0036CA64D8
MKSGLAAVARRQNDLERAGRLHGAAESLFRTAGGGWLQAIGAAPTGPSGEPPSHLSDAAAFERVRAEGAAMTCADAVRYALRTTATD